MDALPITRMRDSEVQVRFATSGAGALVEAGVAFRTFVRRFTPTALRAALPLCRLFTAPHPILAPLRETNRRR
jgi:hypothetical protein